MSGRLSQTDLDADDLSIEYNDDMMVDVLEADDNLKTNDVLKPSPSAIRSGIIWVPIETASIAYPSCAFLRIPAMLRYAAPYCQL